MKNFDLFVDEIVNSWRSDKFEGLNGPPPTNNREAGDNAENYISRKIKKSLKGYSCKKSLGSQTPADIFAIKKIDSYWHIMLIQVKSSIDKSKIVILNYDDKQKLNAFAKYLKRELLTSDLFTRYKNSKIVISTGYAGVYYNTKTNRNYLVKTDYFNLFRHKISQEDLKKIRPKIIFTHNLS
ncbi:hypothetical protein [Flavobacterium litorale]|uniref:Uncharacterized protein n=1 Tax=Flavobacterium litorale TaxID=2856519 RepID=A0ABX8V774_9FLAO|nr:hypothetical protein [Flavobacterium litorale]QYJ67973.1 hypothetical protein K1I41_10600 [Flavobacterium litorale]